jgi:hypothetical protein
MLGGFEDIVRDTSEAVVHWPTTAVRVGAAVLAGLGVAVIHRGTRAAGAKNGLTATLVLLTALMALITLAVGNNAARAFSLVGALSIVRFRTVVEDTRDTAFVVFAVAMGLVIGTGIWDGALVGLPMIGLTALAVFAWDRSLPSHPPAETVVVLRIAQGYEPDAVLSGVMGKLVASARLTSAATAKQGTALELTYTIRWVDEPAVIPLIQEFSRCDGVQAVEVRKGSGLA